MPSQVVDVARHYGKGGLQRNRVKEPPEIA